MNITINFRGSFINFRNFLYRLVQRGPYIGRNGIFYQHNSKRFFFSGYNSEPNNLSVAKIVEDYSVALEQHQVA